MSHFKFMGECSNHLCVFGEVVKGVLGESWEEDIFLGFDVKKGGFDLLNKAIRSFIGREI